MKHLDTPNSPHSLTPQTPQSQLYVRLRTAYASSASSRSASYDFAKSDYYICMVADTGTRILWRLGESIEHTPTKYYVYPPEDYAKWARICIGIIRHYNRGWADGFHYGIRYWEIWKEPEGGGGLMWNGTEEQYYDLYRVAAPIIKAFDPTLRIGGYAAAQVKAMPHFFERFLGMCAEERLPHDFFSWHSYNDDPDLVLELSRYVREGLDRHGFAETESRFNEWNFFDARWETLFLPGSEYYRRDLFERAKGEQGASYAAAVLAVLQDCPVDEANYYDGQPSAMWCGLFDYYGVPTKTYYAFRQFNELRHYARRAEATCSEDGVYVCAGVNGTFGEAAKLAALRLP
ncbi:GH39 family glycosyl hydrolase [Paenibacillus glycinis]|nr:hypothetical protein [Paenibacillus glycinis]